MRVLMLASEMHPYAKTGGLGDVLASLPRALSGLGVGTTVCLPAYRVALRSARTIHAGRLHAPLASRMEPFEVLRVVDAPVPTVLLRADRLFDRAGIYGEGGRDFPDNAERFAFFCRAALEWVRFEAERPDVLHVHDWQAALAPAFLRATAPLYPELAGLRTLLTIHNLAYQGRFSSADWHLLNLDARFASSEYLEFYGGINYLKAGMIFADAITTVSPRYAQEIQSEAFGEGLDGVLRKRRDRLRGILNGIDEEEWNPATDRHLPARYDMTDLRGKSRCKAALQEELGLRSEARVPLLGMVTRLVEQKGLDLLASALPKLLRAQPVHLAVLGNGEARYEQMLTTLAAEFPGRVGVCLGFDEGQAHRIEAGADLFLMPSRFEPCGLNQLYSLRYGTVPVVHATGGLLDTVADAGAGGEIGTGFTFTPFTDAAFLGALQRALTAFGTPRIWSRLIANGMAQDFSWNRAARDYARLYAELPPPPATSP